MNRTAAVAAIVGLGIGGSTAGLSSVDAAKSPMVTVDGGALRGADDGITASFRGIPYAAPPVGVGAGAGRSR